MKVQISGQKYVCFKGNFIKELNTIINTEHRIHKIHFLNALGRKTVAKIYMLFKQSLIVWLKLNKKNIVLFIVMFSLH